MSIQQTSHLRLNVHLVNAGVFAGSWRHPDTDPTASYTIEHFVAIARKAEAALFDAVFLADLIAYNEDVRYRPWFNVEPSALFARIAAQTERIGMVGTFSSSYNDPVELGRRLGDLDHVSGGRLGWNVVTTAGIEAARDYGFGVEPEHALRYRRAEEFTSRVVSGWDELGSPQGHPVIVQAGASVSGRRLASRVAEVIYAMASDRDETQTLRSEIRAQAQTFGRGSETPLLLPGVSTVIGSTEAEARARYELLEDLVPAPYARRSLSWGLGIPADALEAIGDDEPFPLELLGDPDDASGSQTFHRFVKDIVERDRPTFGELLRELGGGGHRLVAGTPEQIADDFEHWFRSGAVDGFTVNPDVLPSGFDDFVEHVVPELRRRGLVRDQYETTTLRGHLGLGLPSAVANVRRAS